MLNMPLAKRKLMNLRAPRPKKGTSSKRVAKPGADGQTLGQRLRRAMDYHGGKLGREYNEADLFRDVNRMLGADTTNPVISQQMLNAILNNRVTRSNFSADLAAVLCVRGPWLGRGIGSMLDS